MFSKTPQPKRRSRYKSRKTLGMEKDVNHAFNQAQNQILSLNMKFYKKKKECENQTQQISDLATKKLLLEKKRETLAEQALIAK